MRSHPLPRRCGQGISILLAVATLVARTAFGAQIPPAEFTFDVTHGGTLLTGCTPQGGAPLGGTCGSETSSPGFAAASGGIGTASYLPVTPGGTVLGTGTAVDALSLWNAGGANRSSATLLYSFQATGPASVNFIPIDVISTGLAAVVGNATATLSLIVRDQGTEANIPAGVHDPDPANALLDLTAQCQHGTCVTSWNTPNHRLTSPVCVVNGDNYTVDISAMTTATSGRQGTNSASAVLDPVIVLDPPYPSSCPITVNPSLFRITTGPGASTGVPAPEPSTLSLAAVAAVGVALALRRPRRLAPSRR
jgi:hypothetical protein